MSNAHLFRTTSRLEEQMMRATMPRTNTADPKQTVAEQARATWHGAIRVAEPLTFTMQETARA